MPQSGPVGSHADTRIGSGSTHSNEIAHGEGDPPHR